MDQYFLNLDHSLKPKSDEAVPETVPESSAIPQRRGRKDEVLDASNKTDQQRHALDFDKITLKGALEYFGLYQDFKTLESSLEGVRENRTTPEQHLKDLKVFGKAVLNKSLECHPDRVKNRGGSKEEMEEAQNQQATLNAIRVFLSVLSETVWKDLKYGFYENLSITTLGREEDVRNRIYDALLKMSYASEFKREHIIPEIRKFLEAGKNCIESFKDSIVPDFKKYRDSALWHLKMCIAGYKNIKTEFQEMQIRCGNGIALDSVWDTSADLSCLIKLRDVAEYSMRNISSCQIFTLVKGLSGVDDYFVLPFVRYVDAIILCNAAIDCEMRNKLRNKRARFQKTEPCISGIDWGSMKKINELYYLVFYFSGNKNKQCEDVVKKIISEHHSKSVDDKKGIEKQQSKGQCEVTVRRRVFGGRNGVEEGAIDKQVIKEAILKCVNKIEEDLNTEFKIENYEESRGKGKLIEDFSECIRKLEEFKKGKEELDKDIDKLKEMNAKFEEAKKEAEELSNELKERIEKLSSGYSS